MLRPTVFADHVVSGTSFVFFVNLSFAHEQAEQHGVTRGAIKKHMGLREGCLSSEDLVTWKKSFQRCAEALVQRAFAMPYFKESRVRSKLAVWNLSGIPARLERRVLKNFALLSKWCPPRVLSVYFRTLWNGWTTDIRMRSLRKQQGLPIRGCMLKCGWDEDSVQHYSCCRVYWHFVSMRRPAGLGVLLEKRSRETFFMLSSDLTEEDVVRLALGMYALHRSVSHGRTNAGVEFHTHTLLRVWTRRTAEGSPAQHLL